MDIARFPRLVSFECFCLVRTACPRAVIVICYVLRPIAAQGGEPDYLGDDMEANYVDYLAKRWQSHHMGWEPIDILADEDAVELAKISAGN